VASLTFDTSGALIQCDGPLFSTVRGSGWPELKTPNITPLRVEFWSSATVNGTEWHALSQLLIYIEDKEGRPLGAPLQTNSTLKLSSRFLTASIAECRKAIGTVIKGEVASHVIEVYGRHQERRRLVH
jgi:hypothetical protein